MPKLIFYVEKLILLKSKSPKVYWADRESFLNCKALTAINEGK